MIRAIDGDKVTDVTELRNKIAGRMPESEVELTILRDGEKKNVKITLGQLPEDDATPQMRRSSLDKLGFSVQTLDEQLSSKVRL